MFKTEAALSDTKLKNTSQALIIDDETDICYLLKSILRQKNIDATYVNTLEEGRQFLQARTPDIIFLDNHLPDGFGMDHIRALRSSSPESKIVMITAHDTTIDRDQAYTAGVDFFIGKPFSRDIIYKTVEKLGP